MTLRSNYLPDQAADDFLLRAVLKRRPGLLVSVRSAAEAVEAVLGGADVIDAKEPGRGAMGPVDAPILREIASAVEGRSVTAAAGELHELDPGWISRAADVPAVRLLKVGLSQRADRSAAFGRIAELQAELPPNVFLAPVLYADLTGPNALDIQQEAEGARRAGLGWLVIDTFDKKTGRLFDWWSPPLGSAIETNGVNLALAGRLAACDLQRAALLRPLLIGVRSQVCGGDREASVQRVKVARAKELMFGD